MHYSYGQRSEPHCNSLGMLQNAAGLAGVNTRDMLFAITVTLIFSVLF